MIHHVNKRSITYSIANHLFAFADDLGLEPKTSRLTVGCYLPAELIVHKIKKPNNLLLDLVHLRRSFIVLSGFNRAIRYCHRHIINGVVIMGNMYVQVYHFLSCYCCSIYGSLTTPYSICFMLCCNYNTNFSKIKISDHFF